MEYHFESLKIEDGDVVEFTLSEVLEMEKLSMRMKDKPISQNMYQKLATKFSSSPHRSGKPPVKWELVQGWFQNKQMALSAKAATSSKKGNILSLNNGYGNIPPPFKGDEDFEGNVPSPNKGSIASKAMTVKRTKAPTISASEAAKVLPNLLFEAKSAKDGAWFDVASFLTYRISCSGELVVRARFSGFGKEEDEWVSVKSAVRERSIPLESSECYKVDVGDHMLCYRESEDDALYTDGHVVEIERVPHGSDRCTCIFGIRYDSDESEAKLPLSKICCRPTKYVPEEIEDQKPPLHQPFVMKKTVFF